LDRNHPVIKEDALLAAFLTEPSFELWRKNTPISLDEESVSKRVDRNEEMTIPSDLEEKLVYGSFKFFSHILLTPFTGPSVAE
jgi:hypothetical protein